MRLFICEKPAQAKLVANRLGSPRSRQGYIETANGIVTWCIGHVVEFLSPKEFDEKWTRWNVDSLPIVPEEFKYKPCEGKEQQVHIIGELLQKAEHVVIATDGDREGELLGRELLDYFKWQGKLERMWNTNLDDESIDMALSKIKDAASYDSLHEAAKARAESDYISGLSLTRAATKCLQQDGGVISVGRVQTAVLGMIVRRDLEIANFVPRPYYDLVASFDVAGTVLQLTHSPPEQHRIYDKQQADNLQQQLNKQIVFLAVEKQQRRQSPPRLYNLSKLQQAANGLFKWSSTKTKDIAQKLYDAQLTSYPRTDCEYLPNEQEKDAAKILEHLSNIEIFAKHINSIKEIKYRKTVFDTAKTTAHHAIVPTLKAVDLSQLTDDEKDLYILIATSYVACFLEDHVYDSTSVKFTAQDREFKSTGNVTLTKGWQELIPATKKSVVLPAVEEGEQQINNLEVLEKRTKAPPKYTQASILKDMENITKFTDDPQVQEQIKSRIKDDQNAGIGTPATRDSFIELLENRDYIKIEKNRLSATTRGKNLIAALPAKASDPIETVIMENKLDLIVDKELTKDDYLEEVIYQTESIIYSIKHSELATKIRENTVNCKICNKEMRRIKGDFGFFWTCSGYPDCKHTMKDENGKAVEKKELETKGACPDCGKPLAKRSFYSRSQKRMAYFWGCSTYPKCKGRVSDMNGKPAL